MNNSFFSLLFTLLYFTPLYFALLYIILFYLILSYFILFYLILSYFILFHLILLYFTLLYFKVLEYKGEQGRGMHLAVLHQGTSVVMTTGTYDVWASTSDSEALRLLVQTISDGRILCFLSKVLYLYFSLYECFNW